MLIEWPTERRSVLPLGRLDDLGQQQQPVLRRRRQHQLRRRLRRYGPDRRADRAATRSTTPSAPRATPTTCAGRSTGSTRRTTAPTRSRPATCSPPAPRRPAREIYMMGDRNPYRIWVDTKANNTLYWGEVGPDAGADVANRGPAAYDEFNRATGPGNYGWPVLRRAERRLQRLGLRGQRTPGLVPVRRQHRAGQQLAPQHRPAAAPADQAGAGLGAARRQRAVAAAGQPRRLRITQPRRGLPLRPEPQLVGEVAAYYDNKWLISEYCRNWVKAVNFDNGNPATGNPTRHRAGARRHDARAPDRLAVRPGRVALHAGIRQRLLLRRRRRRPVQNQLCRRVAGRRSPRRP